MEAPAPRGGSSFSFLSFESVCFLLFQACSWFCFKFSASTSLPCFISPFEEWRLWVTNLPASFSPMVWPSASRHGGRRPSMFQRQPSS